MEGGGWRKVGRIIRGRRKDEDEERERGRK